MDAQHRGVFFFWLRDGSALGWGAELVLDATYFCEELSVNSLCDACWKVVVCQYQSCWPVLEARTGSPLQTHSCPGLVSLVRSTVQCSTVRVTHPKYPIAIIAFPSPGLEGNASQAKSSGLGIGVRRPETAKQLTTE